MPKNERLKRLSQYGGLFTRMAKVSLDECWYCGAPRETLDHCPPISSVETLDITRFKKNGGEFLLIPSCFDCNTLLGAKRLGAPNERLAYLLLKYTKITNEHFCNWEEDQIAEMGYNLKDMIYKKDKMMREYLVKLKAIRAKMSSLNCRT